MEIPVRSRTQMLSVLSALSSSASPATVLKNIRFKSSITHFKPSTKPSSSCKILRITAWFGRPWLHKKKLNHSSEVTRKNLDPANHVVDVQASESYSSNSGPEQGNGQMGTRKTDSKPDKLESSNEPTREAVEWSKMARSGVNPSYFKEERESDEYSEAASKISRAKFLAEEMESGKPVIPKSNSVAKFVTTGQDLGGFINRIKRVSIPPGFLPKVSGVGIAVVSGFLMVWMMKKLFNLGGFGRELTQLEREMLRRKFKARMERERLQKGNLKAPVEESPQLQEEREVENEEDGKSTEEIASVVNMDVKIQNVRMMAKQVRKIEMVKRSGNEGNGLSEDQTYSESSVMEKKDTNAEDKDLIKGDELTDIGKSSKEAQIMKD